MTRQVSGRTWARRSASRRRHGRQRGGRLPGCCARRPAPGVCGVAEGPGIAATARELEGGCALSEWAPGEPVERARVGQTPEPLGMRMRTLLNYSIKPDSEAFILRLEDQGGQSVE